MAALPNPVPLKLYLVQHPLFAQDGEKSIKGHDASLAVRLVDWWSRGRRFDPGFCSVLSIPSWEPAILIYSKYVSELVEKGKNWKVKKALQKLLGAYK